MGRGNERKRRNRLEEGAWLQEEAGPGRENMESCASVSISTRIEAFQTCEPKLTEFCQRGAT